MAVSAGEHERRIRKLMSEVGKLPAQAQRRAAELLRDVDKNIRAELALEDLTDFGTFNAQAFRRNIRGIADDFAEQYGQELDETSQKIFDEMAKFHQSIETAADTPLGAPVLALPQLEILQGIRADLIRDVSDEIVDRVTAATGRQVLGGGSQREVRAEILPFIEPVVRPDGSKVGAFARATSIANNEVQMALTLINEEQMSKDADFLEQRGEDVRKVWIHSGNVNGRPDHIQAERDYSPLGDPGPIKPKQPFLIGSAKIPMQGPRDPSAPANQRINCG